MARLPLVDGDQDQWGELMNEFVSVTLGPDGTLKDMVQPLNFADANGVRRAQFTSVSGDLWFIVNAYWDETQQNFYRIDNTHAAFGYNLQAVGLIPGEPNLGYYVAGATMWVAQPMPYSLIRGGGTQAGGIFGFVGGWELGWTCTQERQLTIGGGGIEIDGYGTVPYGRVLNNTTDTLLHKRMVGMCENAYTDFGGYDDTNQESWYWGYLEEYNPAGGGPPYPVVPGTSRWAVAYQPPNVDVLHPPWTEYLAIKPDGEVTVTADPTAALGVATKQYVDAHSGAGGGAHGGEFLANGDGTTRVWFVAHTLGVVPTRVHLTPGSQASVGCWYTKDNANVGINFATPPANGVQLAVSWSAYP